MDIKLIILKSIYGQLTAEEQQFLDQWLAQDNHQRLYNRLRANINNMQAVEYLAAVDVEKALAEMKSRSSQFSPINSQQGSTSRVLLVPSYLMKVAAVLLLLIVGGTFWYHEHTRVTPPQISEEVQMAMQLGRKSGHTAAKVETLNIQHSSPITQKVRQLYHVDEQFAEQLAEARRITTYQDKEYWVTLDDGTLVHLNYDSRLIYPEKFGDRRDVILDGEAYFMVAKDKSRQFVVHTPQGDVRVYGTEFNVNTRAETTDDSQLATSVVLVRGSVGFTLKRGSETMMKPGQELSIVNSQWSVNEVDTAPYVAWNEGKFFFEEWPLERIMQVIAHWYGRKVEFKSDDIKQQKYSGNFDRYEDIHPTMEAIEAITGLKIIISATQITIEP